jgi:hypothetical protein
MSHKATGPVYRCTRCDRCEQVRHDCIWVRPEADGRRDEEWCLCGGCRTRAIAMGLALTNIDVDFPSVAVA